MGALEAERLEELPLCSCRMEAPKIERLSQGGRSLCMATESVDGQVGGAWGRGRGYRAGGRSLCMATRSVDGQVGGAWGRGRGYRAGGGASGCTCVGGQVGGALNSGRGYRTGGGACA